MGASNVDFLAHQQFFDHLVDLIPAKYYRADEHAHVELRFLPQNAKAAAKQDYKKQAKANKRRKLDPNGPQDKVGSSSSEGEEEAQPGPGSAPTVHAANLGSSSHCSREELQARLHKKIEDVQQLRGQGQKDKKQVAKEAKEWRQKTLQDNAKHKQQEQQGQGNKRKGAPTADQKERKKGEAEDPQHGQPSTSGRTHGGKQQQQQEADFEFARLEFEDKKVHHGKKKLTKQQLLEAAEAKAQEAAAAEGNEEVKAKQASEAWRNAMARAGGEKVLDDPKLLRRSLKKEAKRKDKHSKAWQERKAAQEERQEKKQDRRKANLQARSKAKIDKKKSKSGKKLLRAGFEGRKAGFIGGKK